MSDADASAGRPRRRLERGSARSRKQAKGSSGRYVGRAARPQCRVGWNSIARVSLRRSAAGNPRGAGLGAGLSRRLRAGFTDPAVRGSYRPARALPAVRAPAAGDATAAVAAWRELGRPFEAAVALADSNSKPGAPAGAGTAYRARRRGHRPARSRVPTRARCHPRTAPRGPRPATRANPAQLTGDLVEVVGFLSIGLTKSEIAEELVISSETAGHHVSAILARARCLFAALEAANAARGSGSRPEQRSAPT
jgi:hypothetical protein